jgi:hypothetical protein
VPPDDDWRKNFHPRLAAALEKCDDMPSLRVADLEPGDVLEIETKNHRYAMLVLDPDARKVRVSSDGPHVPAPTEMVVSGSLLVPHGSMIMTGRVALGHCVEFTPAVGGRLVVTPVRSIAVNGVRVFPRDDEDFSMVN